MEILDSIYKKMQSVLSDATEDATRELQATSPKEKIPKDAYYSTFNRISSVIEKLKNAQCSAEDIYINESHIVGIADFTTTRNKCDPKNMSAAVPLVSDKTVVELEAILNESPESD